MRSRLDPEERDARLREIEAELDDELGLDDEVDVPLRPTRQKTGIPWGKVALGAFGLLLFIGLFGKIVRLVIGLAVLGLLVGGVLWLIGLFKGGDEDLD